MADPHEGASPEVIVEDETGRIALYRDVLRRRGWDPAETFTLLRGEVPWRQEYLRLYGRTHPVPRLSAWFGDPGSEYTYSGIVHHPLPWSPVLASLRTVAGDLARVEPAGGPGPNAVLANLYRDGRDSNGWHADDEPELDPGAPIVSFSLGATRRLRLRRRDGSGGSLGVDLVDDSVLVMWAPVQVHWLHQIPKVARPVGERINLTFRTIAADRGADAPAPVPRPEPGPVPVPGDGADHLGA